MRQAQTHSDASGAPSRPQASASKMVDGEGNSKSDDMRAMASLEVEEALAAARLAAIGIKTKQTKPMPSVGK